MEVVNDGSDELKEFLINDDEDEDKQDDKDNDQDDNGSSIYDMPNNVGTVAIKDDNMSNGTTELDNANPYLKQMLKVQGELASYKERNFELENSMNIYKDMLIERDAKIKAL